MKFDKSFIEIDKYESLSIEGGWKKVTIQKFIEGLKKGAKKIGEIIRDGLVYEGATQGAEKIITLAKDYKAYRVSGQVHCYNMCGEHRW